MEWDVSPILIDLGVIQIRWYGALFAFGFYGGYRILSYFFKKEGFGLAQADRFFVYIFFGTLIGARLGHCLFYEPDVFLADPIRILKIWEGGLASHGAGIGTVTAIWLFSRKFKKLGFFECADRLIMGVSFCAGMIRIGNFFNSEIVGKPTDLPWAVKFMRLDSVPRHPAQLYESITVFCILGLLYGIQKKGAFKYPGLMFGTFFVTMFSARFLIEFIKEAQVPFELSMQYNMGQLLSIPFILAGVVMILNSKRLHNAQNQ